MFKINTKFSTSGFTPTPKLGVSLPSRRGFTPFRDLIVRLRTFQIKNLYNKLTPRLNKNQSLTGFTLIELLVVIAIIGLLASVVLVSLNSARKKARDTKRAADIDQIYKALNLYYDKYGCLPITSGSTCGTASGGAYNEANAGGWDYSSQGTGFMQFLQTSGFMSKVPVDPINNMTGDNTPAGSYAYRYYCYTGTPAGLHLAYIREEDGSVILKNITSSGNWADSSFTCQ